MICRLLRVITYQIQILMNKAKNNQKSTKQAVNYTYLLANVPFNITAKKSFDCEKYNHPVMILEGEKGEYFARNKCWYFPQKDGYVPWIEFTDLFDNVENFYIEDIS